MKIVGLTFPEYLQKKQQQEIKKEDKTREEKDIINQNTKK